jgi:methylmalonyl-CoA mutase N-terminal domain/subunit
MREEDEKHAADPSPVRAVWKAKNAEEKEREPLFETSSGIPLEPFYTDEDLSGLSIEKDLACPGDYPFTRGVYPTMYRGRFWTMRQYSGYASAAETNRRFKYLLEQGQTGLSVAFDLPTQLGYDSDSPLAEGEVGKVGVAIASVEDMRLLFDGIPLAEVSTSMTINATAAILLAMYIAVAKSQGALPSNLSGTIQNDILKEYIARGTYIFPPAASMRITTDIFKYCSEAMPRWNMISISGYHIREAGSNAVQEVAFTLGDAIAYVEAAVRAGLEVDAFAPRLSFFFNAHNNLLEEVAKFRAARRLWSRIMKERFGAKNENSMKLRFHTQTAGSTLTAAQPENNVVRVALQALAAVLGGTQSLHTNSRDEALALPTIESATVALRTQQILAHESGVADLVDPLGGSYALEVLTARIEEEANRYLKKIESLGGMQAAIERGYVQNEIAESAYRYQKQVESAKKVVVGVNRYQERGAPVTFALLKIDDAIEREQREKLALLRKHRDSQRVRQSLDALKKAAGGDENLMPSILEAVECRSTLGEISDALRAVLGEYRGQAEWR